MSSCFRSLLPGVLGLALVFTLASAQDAARPDAAKAESKPDPGKETVVNTRHEMTLGGNGRLAYEATAGTLPLRDYEGKVTANVFFVAYTKAGAADLAKRPITFTFNGGPGSSSVWLHLGAFGPRRVKMSDQGEALPPPAQLADNDLTLLDVTDLVFIDPVTTGYSRAVTAQNAKQFHGVQQDLESVGEFIRLYAARYRRWASPKFLAGESYGTTRAAGLAGHLQERHGMYFNGIILVSSILNFQTARFDEGNDLPYPLFLPSYTATAWYHKKLPSDLQGDLRRTLREVEDFAQNEYTLALMKGDRLADEERRQVARKLARYTGLSEDYINRSNLRVEIRRFTKELLREQERTVGRFDSRLKGRDRDAAGEAFEQDPSYAAIQGPYSAALNQYLRSELKFESDLPYEILTGKVSPWDYGEAKNRYLNVAPSLRQAMARNPHLRVFVANGYYDLATPYFATEYTFHHLGLEGTAARVTLAHYDAGHMMYTHRESHRRLKKDLAAFVAACVDK